VIVPLVEQLESILASSLSLSHQILVDELVSFRLGIFIVPLFELVYLGWQQHIPP
jgi:hypothetical protein